VVVFADPAADPLALIVQQAVVAHLGDRGGQLPSEHIVIELLQRNGSLSHDLKVRDGIRHGSLL
jgi:hypothetical protein